MAEEKFNKDWKESLDDVSNLQHAALQNKEAAWEKLYARLDEKPRNKKAVWYWVAAASVIILIIISTLTTHQPTISFANNNNNSNEVKKSITKKDETLKPVTAETSVQTQQQPHKNIFIKHDLKKAMIADTSLTVTALINNSNNSYNQNIISIVTADSSAKTIVVSTSIQKKLKVVHVNELGEPVEFYADVAHTTDLHLFQLKLAQQEIYNASTIAANNNSISFKPRNSPN